MTRERNNEPAVLDFSTPVGDRDPASFRLSEAEADAMIALGFTFAVYDKHELRFELRAPYGLSRDGRAGTWIFRQAQQS